MKKFSEPPVRSSNSATGNFKSLISIILVSFFTGTTAFSQNPVSTVSLHPDYIGVSAEDLAQMDSTMKIMLPANYTIHAVVNGSQNVSKLAVKLGLSDGGSDLFYKEFDFGTEGDFDDGTSYHASGSSITLGIGRFGGYGEYHVEVRAIKDDGSLGDPLRAVLN